MHLHAHYSKWSSTHLTEIVKAVVWTVQFCVQFSLNCSLMIFSSVYNFLPNKKNSIGRAECDILLFFENHHQNPILSYIMVCDKAFKALCIIRVILTKCLTLCYQFESTVSWIVYTVSYNLHVCMSRAAYQRYTFFHALLNSFDMLACLWECSEFLNLYRFSLKKFTKLISLTEWNRKLNTHFICVHVYVWLCVCVCV